MVLADVLVGRQTAGVGAVLVERALARSARDASRPRRDRSPCGSARSRRSGARRAPRRAARRRRAPAHPPIRVVGLVRRRCSRAIPGTSRIAHPGSTRSYPAQSPASLARDGATEGAPLPHAHQVDVVEAGGQQAVPVVGRHVRQRHQTAEPARQSLEPGPGRDLEQMRVCTGKTEGRHRAIFARPRSRRAGRARYNRWFHQQGFSGQGYR